MATSKNDSNKKDSSATMDDVTRPGKTPVSATSRPVIVGHKPLLKQDPMVANSEDAEDPADNKDKPKAALTSASERVIEPLSEIKEEAEVSEEKQETNNETPPTEEKVENNPEENLSGSSSAAVDVLASEVSAKREAEKASEEDVKKLAEIEHLIESRKYFVPIGEVSKRRMNHILIGILVLVLLAAAGANFAIDAELIDIGTQPLTDVL